MAMNITGAKTQSASQTGFKRRTWLAAAVLGLFLAQAAFAEEAQPPQPPPVEQQTKEPGVFESIARWFERGFSNFKSGIDDAKGNIDTLGNKAASAGKNIGDKAAEVGKGAADAVKKLPATRVVEGRVQCDVAANGAPDCRTAALSICRAKGFAEGQSVDFVSAEKCPAAVWMSRRKPEPGECVTETFVTRAMCQ